MADDDDERSMRWRRFGELPLEKALLESHASADSVKAVTSQLHSAGGKITSERLDALARLLDVDDGKSVLLSVLGRGESPLRSLWLENNSDSHALRESEALALCVNLASNSGMDRVSLRGQNIFGTSRGCELLGNALATNEAVKELYLPTTDMLPEAVKCLMKGLDRNSTLLLLDLGNNLLRDEGVGYVADHMLRDKTITKLQLHNNHSGIGGAVRMAGVLQHNTCLTSFTFGHNPIQKEGMEILLRPLIHDGDLFSPSSSPKNKTLKALALEHTRTKHFSVESVAEMLRTNKTLSLLEIMHVHFETEHWVDTIIPALKDNDTLQFLNVNYCQGITEDVLEPLMRLVRDSKSQLERIHMIGTDISPQGGLVNEELRKNKEYRSNLRHQELVKPRFGRVILCGYQFAGKTTICRTIAQRGSNSQSHKWKLAWKKFLQKHPFLRQFLYGKGAYLERKDRTRGFDILTVGDERDATSIWDFAGQREFYILYDYLFPKGGNTCFLYVCSARCSPDEYGSRVIKDERQMKDELRFWLRFLASNSRFDRENVLVSHRRLPDVTFVLTNRDTLTDKEVLSATQTANRIVAECKEEFKSVITLSEDVDIIDGHSSADVDLIFAKVNRRLAEILKQSTEYAVCEEVRRALRVWAVAHPFLPLLRVEEFEVICSSEVRQALSPDMYAAAQLGSRAGRESVLAYLNDVGEIFFVRGLQFIVVNPRWFGVGLLGHLISTLGENRALEKPAPESRICCCCKPGEEAEPWWLEQQRRFVSRDEIDHLLRKSLKAVNLPEKVSTHNLIALMTHLEMCFEERPNTSGSRVFIPALFNDARDVEAGGGRRRLRWEEAFPLGERVHYVGRRLECENAALTFLTPGFFPRLQVVLRNYLHGEEWTQRFCMARNLIYFVVNGMEVQVEYCGDIDYFVDILIKSSASQETMLRFLEEHLVKKIREFCASPQGCQGVQLAEAVIRPVCVRELFVCSDRKPHAVRVSTLREKINGESGKSYRHSWKGYIENARDMDFALDLLRGEGSYKRFIAANQVQQTDDSQAGTRPGPYLSRLQTRLPKRFFPTIDDVSFIRTLESPMNLARVIPIKFHLMCDGIDGIDGPHEVKDQPGRTMKLSHGESRGTNLPILKYAIRLLWIGVKVTGGAVLHVPTIREIDDWAQTLFSEEVPLTVDMLKRIMGNPSNASPSAVPGTLILELLAQYMVIDPETQWLHRFLNLTDSQRFHADFQLRPVESIGDESGVRWVCQHHCESGIREGRVRSVEH